MEYEISVPKIHGTLALTFDKSEDSNTFIVSGRAVIDWDIIQPAIGDKLVSVWGSSASNLTSSQLKDIITKSGESIVMKFTTLQRSNDISDKENDSKATFFPQFSFSAEDLTKAVPNDDCEDIMSVFRSPKTADGKGWTGAWSYVSGEGLGIRKGQGSVLPMVIHDDLSFEFRLGPQKDFPGTGTGFRGRIGPCGHPQPHMWMFDIDDGGIPNDGENWRGVLVLKRSQEAVFGKFLGDCVEGELSLENSERNELIIRILFWLLE